MAEVSPSTSAGTSARGSAGRPPPPSATRRGPVPPAAAKDPVARARRRPCRSRSTAAMSEPRSTVSSRPETRTVLPTSTRRHDSTAWSPPTITSTGARTAQAWPRPLTRRAAPERSRSHRTARSAPGGRCGPRRRRHHGARRRQLGDRTVGQPMGRQRHRRRRAHEPRAAAPATTTCHRWASGTRVATVTSDARRPPSESSGRGRSARCRAMLRPSRPRPPAPGGGRADLSIRCTADHADAALLRPDRGERASRTSSGRHRRSPAAPRPRLNRPFSVRQARIFPAITGPTPGSSSSSACSRC